MSTKWLWKVDGKISILRRKIFGIYRRSPLIADLKKCIKYWTKLKIPVAKCDWNRIDINALSRWDSGITDEKHNKRHADKWVGDVLGSMHIKLRWQRPRVKNNSFGMWISQRPKETRHTGKLISRLNKIKLIGLQVFKLMWKIIYIYIYVKLKIFFLLNTRKTVCVKITLGLHSCL